MTRINLPIIVATTLAGWSCLWPLGWLCSWPTWWFALAVAFFVATSLLFARAFLDVAGPDSGC